LNRMAVRIVRLMLANLQLYDEFKGINNI